MNDAQHAEAGAVSLSGTVESREYYGLYIKYYINVGSQTLKVIERNDGVHLHRYRRRRDRHRPPLTIS